MNVGALAAAVALLALAASAGVRSGAAASSPAYAKLCRTITGPRWTIRSGHETVSGTRYQVGVLDVPCTTAVRYVKKFYVRRSPGSKALLAGGPAGYLCRSTAPKRHRAYQGSCKQKRGPSILAAFAWAPKR